MANLIRSSATRALLFNKSILNRPVWASASQLIHTTAVRKDIDSAAKYIGAGAATVGVAGAGML